MIIDLLIVAMGWDWDEVLMVCMGFAGLAYIIVDQKRTSKLDDVADDHAAQLIELKLLWAHAAEQADLDLLQQQVSRLGREEEQFCELCQRVATLEARADHRPITQTRRKDGKFATAEEPPK